MELLVLFETDAGFVRPELAMDAALQQAKQQDGVEIWDQAKATSLKEISSADPPHLEIKMQRNGENAEMVTKKTVLVAVGAWASQLIQSWSNYLTVT